MHPPPVKAQQPAQNRVPAQAPVQQWEAPGRTARRDSRLQAVSQRLGFSQLQVTAAWETAQQLNSTLHGAADADKVIRNILQKQMAAGARDSYEEQNAPAAVEELLEELQLDRGELQADLERVRQEQMRDVASVTAELMAQGLEEQRELAEKAKLIAEELRKRPDGQAPEDELAAWQKHYRPSSRNLGSGSSSSAAQPPATMPEQAAEEEKAKEALEAAKAEVAAKIEPGSGWKQVDIGAL